MTDWRDAIQLAQFLRSGALTPVSMPGVEAEANRDLMRARQDALNDLKAAQVRRKAFLRRPDIGLKGGPTGERRICGRSQVGPGLRLQAGSRAREEHAKKAPGNGLSRPSGRVGTPGTARSDKCRTYGLPCPERSMRV
jgi:hypothetical protein